MSDYSVSLKLQVQQALQSLKNLTGNFKKVDQEVAATTRELEKFEKELKDESATIKNTISAQTAYINKLKGMQAGLDKSSKKFGAVSREITKFEGRLKTGTTAIQGLTGALAVVGAGAVLGKITGDVLALGKEFSAAEGSVRTLTGAAGFNDVQASIKKVSEASGGLTNRIEATAASYQLLSAGVSGAENIEKVLESSVALTTAGFTDQTTAVDALTTVINAYGLEADKAALLTDQLVQTQNDGKLTINEYGRALGKVIPTAATLGVGFGEVNAAIAGITLQGQNADIATSGLNSALNKLAAPTKEGESILGKYGITVNAASIKADGLVGTLEKLKKITSDQDKIKLFGSEAFKALGPLLNNFEKFKELVENQAEATGVAKAAVDNLANGYATLSKKNENLRTDVGVAVFEQLKPAIGAVLVPINNLLAAFLKLPGPIKNVVIGLGLIVGAAVGLALTVAAVGALKVAIVAATAGTTAWAAATTVLAGAWAVITAPITLAVAAVVALIAGAVLLYKNFEPFRRLVDAIGNAFKKFGNEARIVWAGFVAFAKVSIDTVGKVWNRFVGRIKKAWGLYIEFIEKTLGFFKNKTSDILEAVGKFWSGSVSFIKGIWGRLTGALNKDTEGVGDTNAETTGGIQKAWANTVNFIRRIWAKTFESLASIAKQSLKGVALVLKTLFGVDVEAALKKALEDAKAAVAKARAGVKAPGTKKTTTKTDTTKDKPIDLNLNGGGNDTLDTAKNASKTTAQKEAERKEKERKKLEADQAKAFQTIERDLSRDVQLRSEMTLDGKVNTDLEKERLRIGFEYLDVTRQIEETVAEGQQAELFRLAKIKRGLQEKAALVESASDFPGFFAEAAKTDKELNSQLSITKSLLKSSYDIVSQQLQSGIKGLIDGTKSWGEVLTGILNQLSSFLLNTAFNALGSSLFNGGAAAGGNVFKGLFADGGTLGAGEWGIAGEAGPEIVSGPARITPMNKGGNTVVNITVNSNGGVSSSARGNNAEDAARLGRLIERSTLAIINREKRAGGSLSR